MKLMEVVLVVVLLCLHSAFAQNSLFLNRGYVNFPQNSVVGVPTSSFGAGLNVYPTANVVFTPLSSPGSAIIFYPPTLTFSSNPVNLYFYYQITTTGPVTIYWQVSGENAANYTAPLNVTVQGTMRAITCSPFATTMPIGSQSNTIRCSTDYPAPDPISLTPVATGLTFNPPTISFSNDAPTAQLSFTAVEGTGATPITFTPNGGTYVSWYNYPLTQTVTVNLRTFDLSYTTLPAIVPGQMSPVYTITTNWAPLSEVTIFLNSSNGGVTFFPSTLVFSPSVTSQTFQYTASISGTFSYVIGGPNATLYAPPAITTVTVNKLTMTDPNYVTQNCGDAYDYVLSLTSPPPNGVLLEVFANGATVSPSAFNFTPATSSIPFTMTGNYVTTTTVRYVVTGQDSALVNTIANDQFNIVQKTITVPTFTGLLPGVASAFVISVNVPPSSDLTITPNAPGITFNPAQWVFNTNSLLSVSFTATPTNPGTVLLSYTITGTDAGCFNVPPAVNINVGQLPVTITPTMITVPAGVQSPPYTLTINNLLSPVTVTPYGNGLTFNPPTLSLTQALPSAFFTYVGSIVGSPVINFNVSGSGSVMVAPVTPVTSPITQRTFTVPTFPAVYVGVPSDPLTIGLTYAPPTQVLLRLWAPDTTFTPETLTFTPTQSTQSFTFVSTSASAKTVTFFVEGTDAALYQTSPGTFTFTPQLRPLSRSTPDTPTFNSPFIFTISTPFLPPNGLTFTPVGAFTFNPPTATITPTGPGAVAFTAIPNDIGNTPLKIITSGDTTLYQTVGDITVNTQTASFTLDLPSTTTTVSLVQGVPSAPFYIYASVPPVNDVTLTITSPMVTVKPSTITFTPTSTVGSFVVTADTSVFGSGLGGAVTLTYTVSGTDALNFAMGQSTFQTVIHTPTRQLSVTPAAATITVKPGQLTYFSISAVDIPINSVTVTPMVNANSFVTITPASAVFTPTVTTATFAITTTVPTAQTTLEVTVSGPDAYLYKDSAQAISPFVVFSQGVITTNMPTVLNVAQPTVVEFMDISVLVPQNPLTVTPYVISGPPITFTPASLVFSPTALSLRYSILASAPGTAQIGFTVTGTNANLFTINTATSILVQPLSFFGLTEFTGDTLVVGVQSRSFSAYVPYLPPTGVTLTPVSAELTFNPPTFAFSPTVGAVMFTVTPNVVSRQSVISVSFTVTGTDMALFSIPASLTVPVVPRTLTLIATDTLYGGVPTQLSLVAQYPPPNGFTVSAMANGVQITPSVLTFTPNQSSIAFTVTPIASGINIVSLSTVLSGTDANWYSSPALQQTPVQWGTITVPDDVGSGYTVSGTIQLTPAPSSTVIVTPVAEGVTFIPPTLVFSPSVSSQSFSAMSSVPGTAQFTYTLSGPSAGFYRMTTATQSTTALFETLDILVTSPTSISYNYVAGSVSRPFVVSTQTSSGVLVAPTQQIFIVPTANFADAVFTPANVSIVAPANTATFTVSTNTPGNLVLGFNVYGPGATGFSTNVSAQLTVAQRSFDIDPNLFVNLDYTPSTSSVFFYNVTSGPFTIYARSVPSDVNLTLFSDNFIFNPSTLYFDNTTTSANFTITGSQIGAAVISFLVGGSDADTFAVPAPHTYTRVTYQILLPVVPALSVGVKSEPQTISIIPVPTEPFILYLPSPTGRIVYNPTQLVFPIGQNTSSFTVTAFATTFTENQTPSIPGQVQPITTSPNPISISGRENGEFETYNIPLATPTSVNVVPGIFILHHPRYQMNVKSHVDVALSVAPRSDVVVTLYGNNMLFEPPHVTFTANGPLKQEVKVTPLHATSYEIDYSSFKVNYVCSGTNVNDYLCPSETLHYIALPRGYIAAAVTLPAAFVIFCIVVGIILYRRRHNSSEEKPRRMSVSVGQGGVYQSFSNSPAFPSPQLNRQSDENSHLLPPQ